MIKGEENSCLYRHIVVYDLKVGKYSRKSITKIKKEKNIYKNQLKKSFILKNW